MKKFTLLLSVCMILNMALMAQEVVVAGWTFPGQSAVADTGLQHNLEEEITTQGGTSDIEFKNGFESKAAQAKGWDEGMDQKAWVISFSSEGHANLNISSRQQSGGNDPGPKDFKLQFSVDSGTTWEDIDNGAITVENDWETSFVDQLPLPEACDNQPILMIRWIMTSNEASGSSGDVQSNGKSKIDEIFIRGEEFNAVEELEPAVLNVYPNPASDFIRISSTKTIEEVTITDISGKAASRKSYWNNDQISLDGLSKGLYLVHIKITGSNIPVVKKLMIK